MRGNGLGDPGQQPYGSWSQWLQLWSVGWGPLPASILTVATTRGSEHPRPSFLSVWHVGRDSHPWNTARPHPSCSFCKVSCEEPFIQGRTAPGPSPFLEPSPAEGEHVPVQPVRAPGTPAACGFPDAGRQSLWAWLAVWVQAVFENASLQ